ncbi:MAG TPA: phage holin family protein [Gaiellaceae bacterium]|nr:phage holin family protein [Gaiellaceae bacterium]
MPGLTDATKRVADHARSIVQLELRLATAEVKRKLVALGAGIGLTVAAGVIGFFGLVFGLAAGAAALTLVLSVWLALLAICGGLLLFAGLLAMIGIRLLRRGAKPVPEQAIEEAQLTREALQDGDGA